MSRTLFLFLFLFTVVPYSWAVDGRSDYDLDDNGLIEINDWADLHEVRNNLDGSALYGSSAGCPVDGCIGFELTTDLDFDTNGDGALDSSDTFWNGGEGWQPIGSSSSDAFSGVFHGNGHLIRNLMTARPDVDNQGLFGAMVDATVQELGLSGPMMHIQGKSAVGGLVGYAQGGQITATFVSGYIDGKGTSIGGLVGSALGTNIVASYVTGLVNGEGDRQIAGLVGYRLAGDVIASLSTAYMQSSVIGGLVGYSYSGDSADTYVSYWATDASGQKISYGGTPVTLTELQCPTSADNTSCAEPTLYETWAEYTDAQGNPYWDYGTDSELPGLRLQGRLYRDGDGDGAEADYDDFPVQFAASVDSDGDGAPDFWKIGCEEECRIASGLVLDQFPDSFAATIDTDMDGLPDRWNDDCDSACQSASGLTLDDDNDGDGVANIDDAFPANPAAAADADNDGMPDAWHAACDSDCQATSGLTLDPSPNDTDNDGVINDQDAFVDNSAAAVDADDDGLPDAWLESCDSTCQSNSGLTLDTSLNDTDNDGVVNEEDDFINNSAASVDTDGDGYPDSWLATCDSACQSASGLTLDDDNDNDGVANEADAFPVNAAAAVDADGDGLPDAWLDSCDSACQSASGLTLDDDNDNDGVANNQDAFPLNAAASVDGDNDGLPDAWLESCDTACQSNSGLTLDTSLNDTDNDGVVNGNDAFVNNAAAAVDTDGDGQPDAWLDSCDSACQSASGLTLDEDNDNDGVVNSEDPYPLDNERSVDADAPELLQVPQAISMAATGDSTLVTLNVMEAQAIDNFDDELEFQVELNSELLIRNEDQQVSLPSGALSLQWFAVDDAGNRSEPLAQMVNIYPQVRFAEADSITGEQRVAPVALRLSGPSPEYPVSILVSWVESESIATSADVVTEGDNGVNLSELIVTIESAEAQDDAALLIPVAADEEVEPDEYLTLELAAALAGSDTTFEMPINADHQRHRLTITDTNIAPTVTVTAAQNGEQGTVFVTDAGEVTLNAEVTDVNGGDSHSYQWYTSELPVTPGDEASFTFNPQSMAVGEYSVSIVVTDDGVPMLSSEQVEFTFTLQEADGADGGDDGDNGDGGNDDTGDGISTGGGQTPVPEETGNSGGGSSGGSVGFWLLCMMMFVGLWRRRSLG
ncbi:GlyGly-CTERM sorting domain-containing protein [Microbulbifer sp. MCCC 1A16149]|uniref:GlyGly-CTERM sorting domain-containing protein n=1 Tax=Microbulbifer sp. MCCC 1A16149 TaxID=3411322 RepID=UPI003D123609